MKLFLVLAICLVSYFTSAECYITQQEAEDADRRIHPPTDFARKLKQQEQPIEDPSFWPANAQENLKKKLQSVQIMTIENEAKNVILFLGDGMSVPTVTAARIMKGQKVDNLPFGGEEGQLHIDTFPYTGVSRTFCADAQVADSACSATAYLGGTKANTGTCGVTSDVLRYDCAAQAIKENQVSSVLAWAQAQNKSTGVITTTRITHASPSGTYAHIADRDWENDSKVVGGDGDPKICPDIAQQLIKGQPGDKINVIMGGGRLQFLPNTVADPENENRTGYRLDGENLIETWKKNKEGEKASYVHLKDDLLKVNTDETDYLLGLFSADHLAYYHEQEADQDPSLEQMTEIAIKILSKNPNGFFLFVEGGRIDHAHHDNFPQRALWETIEFDKAIKKGDDITEDKDTLIVVTSDHAHVMSIAGYPTRGNSILEIADIADDGKPFGTLSYANGPALSWLWDNSSNTRKNITNDDFQSRTYQPPSPVPTDSETHGGDDVLIFAKGPYAHLLTGVHLQSYIPHVVAYASCIGSGATHCEDRGSTTPPPGAAGNLKISTYLVILAAFAGTLVWRY